jgi:two-component system, chemotaxis family, sensor kinase CheA
MKNNDTIIRDQFARLEDDWESASRYLSLFVDESRETLDELTDALLALEAGGGRENLEQLFISAHRIKGSAASIGLNRPAKLAHLMEDLLQVLVDTERAPEPKMVDGLLACTDGLRQYVNALRTGRPEADKFAVLAEQLLESQTGKAAPLPSQPAPVEAPPAEAVPEANAADVEQTIEELPSQVVVDEELRTLVAAAVGEQESENVLLGRIVFEPGLEFVGLKARLVCNKLSNFGNIRYLNPPLEEIENREEIQSLCFGIVTEKSPTVLKEVLHVAGISGIVVEPLDLQRREAKKQTVGGARAPEPGAKTAETLRVDVERLDRLMNLAGQLAIGKAQVSQIGARLKDLVSGEKSVQVINDLFETIQLLDSVSNDIRQNVMDMRMLPIGPLLHRFHRVIRDITRANGKTIRLTISGEKTELDKRMIDELADPLIHLVRNAADHGIETPEARAAVGKPRQGTISLDAFHRGSSIVIRVSDDGKGLDADRLRNKAVEKGLIPAADADAMTNQQIYQLIWLPGLSTAEKVTDVSGRGVGMDIVRGKIKELNGAVDVDSQPGRGTTFTMRLPLTLAVLPSLMVEDSGEVFAVPLESVVEIVRVAREDMSTVHGQWMALVRGRVVAVATLDSLFDWRRHSAKNDAIAADNSMLVIVGEGGRQIGLAVDRVIGDEDVVIKSIADNYHNVAGVAGASILGDGRVSLILDPPTLIEMASNPAATAGKT